MDHELDEILKELGRALAFDVFIRYVILCA